MPLLIGGGIVFVLLARGRVHFDFNLFVAQLRFASPVHIVLAAGLILSTNWIRSMRWAIFLRPVRRVAPFSLAGAQFIGFSAVALFGRIADLTRPYLVSRRVGLSLASQIAVYTIERIFDLAGVAVLFSALLFVTPRSTPHHEVFVRTGLLALGGTVFLCVFAGLVWHSGERIAVLAGSVFGRISEPFARGVERKILGFREGLNALGSFRELVLVTLLSVCMWSAIAEAYVQVAHAFLHTPALASLTFATTTPLMAASMGGSLLRLPVVGWFTQIAITAGAMHALYGASIEDATACGAVLLIVNTLSVIPVGLVYSRVERISFRDASRLPASELG